jgi:hypothetical protein
MPDIVFHMTPGEQVCERTIQEGMCLKPAKDYKRNNREKRGWPNPNTPIGLCDEHAAGRKLLK